MPPEVDASAAGRRGLLNESNERGETPLMVACKATMLMLRVCQNPRSSGGSTVS